MIKSINEIENKTKQLFKRISKIMAPPPNLSVSEWADVYRRLSSEASAEPGQWRTERAPYQKKIMDEINNPRVEIIILMTSAQVGKTEIILNAIGYFIDYDPSPIMVVQPTVEMAETFSKTRLAPMLRDTPALKGKVADIKSRNSSNTILEKSFPGGVIVMVGANSSSALASRPIRVLLADEVDRFPASAGTEGDPVSLAEKRTTTFSNRKKIFVSTPTIKGASRIEKFYNSSNQQHWHLPCPSCGEHQQLKWGQITFEYDDVKEEVICVKHRCKFCGFAYGEYEWKTGEGKWIADNPNSSIVGFHINELASPWKHWDEIVVDFKQAKKDGKESLKVWVNTSLGETWEEKGVGLESDELLSRREEYSCDVPENVAVLTAGVDVQDNRLEYEVVGWGINKESWGIEYGVLMGDPGKSFVWKALDDVLFKTFSRADGVPLNIMSTCVDTGGHHTSSAYAYCKDRELQRVWAIKGIGGSGHSFIKRPKRREQSGVYLFTIGVDVGKDTLVSRLTAKPDQNGYCHFPFETEKGYDDAYFKGLTAEHRVTRYKNGQTVIKWEKKSISARNEPFDLRNYATAALEILNPNINAILNQLNGEQSFIPKKIKKRRRVVSKGIS
ncbi:phage terminase large subunit GpA-like protein [Sedimentibacter acidaminivorans]|uniref:Phage terminase large subunit GpA-like protein n=1 Tax=Sedimentibacter acidaminivorans TaxID=913099 RepID=A0ABS4GA96_9FIRM|nr:phage terminase large subunit family protein [Sedimentibacter acidaminivorans]MBP1924604.1 phage terminase large subunit GpA-like protein [Sedimentibacter acidaminivorans]